MTNEINDNNEDNLRKRIESSNLIKETPRVAKKLKGVRKSKLFSLIIKGPGHNLRTFY